MWIKPGWSIGWLPASRTEGRGGGRRAMRQVDLRKAVNAVSAFACDETTGQWCDFTLEFDSTTPKILMLSLVQEAIRKTLIHQIEGVGVCSFVANDKESIKYQSRFVLKDDISHPLAEILAISFERS